MNLSELNKVAEAMVAPGRGILLCVALSLVFVWAGLTVTYYSRFPVGFLISGIAFAGYLLARVATVLRRPAGVRPQLTRPTAVRTSDE